MAGRSVTKALRCGECVVRSTIQSADAACQRRTFTSTALRQKHGAVPTFTETTSAELEQLLSTFRNNVFLPAHLSNAHRDLMFGSKYRKSLDEDPVKVDIEGEEFSIRHVDRTKDQPDTAKGLFQAVSLMKDKKDWDNLPVLLEGLKIAGRTLKPYHLEKLVRKAGLAGRQDAILECARRVSKTGFALKNANLVREIMWWIQYKAASSDWDARNTEKALSMAEQVAVMLEDERHAGARVVRGSSDARARPEVVGVLLELAAAKARQNGATDKDGKVKKYAERLISIMKDDRNLNATLPVQEGLDAKNSWLRFVSTIIYGMKAAGKVVNDTGIRNELNALASTLDDTAANEKSLMMKEMPEGTTPVGLWSYNTLVSGKS